MFKFTLLRFSGFDDEWKKCKLKEISNIQDGTHATPNYTDEGIPFYSVETITSDAPPKFISNEEHQKLIKRCEPKFGDILLTRIGTLAKSKIVDWHEEFSIYVSLALLSEIKINNKFLNQYIQTEIYQKEFLKRSLLLAIPQKINLKDLNETIIKYPSKKEEEKIANFLDLIDKKIELLTHKYKKYVSFKKYLMQQIFTQKLRFNFIDDWDVVKLETLIEKGKAGGTPPSTNPDYYNGEIPFLSIKDMTEQGKYIVKTEKSITEEGLNNSSAWIIPKYSLLYSIYASIGLVSINLTEVSTSQAIYGIILKEGVSLEYMYYYLTYFKKNIHRYVETGTQGNLNAKLLKSFEIALPSVDEQEMIVNILSLVDKKIENMEKEVGKMNEFKKGLLQQMFI